MITWYLSESGYGLQIATKRTADYIPFTILEVDVARLVSMREGDASLLVLLDYLEEKGLPEVVLNHVKVCGINCALFFSLYEAIGAELKWCARSKQ